jgi:hypothetical protein
MPTPNPDGSFILRSVMPGGYRLYVFHPPNYCVKQASYNGIDVLKAPLVASSSPETVNIVLSPNVARVTETVVDLKRQPASGVQVVLVPEKDRDGAELYKSAITDTTGRFTVTGITLGGLQSLCLGSTPEASSCL